MIWLLVALFAGQFETTFHAGLVALNQNNLGVAEAQLESASKLAPGDARVWLALAQTYRRLDKTAQAQAAARNAEKLASNAAMLKGLALYYSEAADFAKAAEMLQSAIRRNALDESSYFDLAQIYLKQQNFAAALETLNAGRTHFDKSAQLALASGVAYYGLRRFPEATDAFLGTIRLDPDVPQPYVFLGRMLDQAEEKLPRITEVFAGFARSAPDNYMSSFLYGKALALQGHGDAEAQLRQSIRQNGQFWESHFELGVLLDRRGEFAEAAQEIRRSVELNPNDPVPHYRLARLYDRLGKTAEARVERELHARLAAAGAGTQSGMPAPQAVVK
jgi:tetratricopeptide (TPR) repeat protein